MATYYGTIGHDTISGSTSSDLIYGYPDGGFPEDETGNDSLRGGDGNDNIYGGGGNDTLRGDAGGDDLFGGNGNDVLDGGVGNDVYDGGAGNDTFLVRDNLSDTFRGGQGTDTLLLADAVSRQTFILDADAGVEILNLAGFRLSGSDFSDDFDFSGLTTVGYGGVAIDLGAGHDDFIGHSGADFIRGGVGNDSFFGGAGNDTFSGGQGGDEFDGGAGDDTFLIDSTASDTFFGGDGTDTVRLEGITARFRLILNAAAGVERLDRAGFTLTGTNVGDTFDFSGLTSFVNSGPMIDLGSGNDLYIGYSGADAVEGGSGTDTLRGGGGNDTLFGGTGGDSLQGGTGDDIYIVDSTGDIVDEAGGSGRDSVRSSVNFNLAESATTRGALENLVLTGTGNTIGGGNAFGNIMVGNVGNNVLVGYAGNDGLYGGVGNDALYGGTDADTLDGGSGADTLGGGQGADLMIGGADSDTYYVDQTGDTVVEAVNGGLWDVVAAGIDYTLGANVESLVLTGAAIRGTGNAQANRIEGTAGNNILSGGLGNDTLLGGDGRDTLSGGDGADGFVFAGTLRDSNVDHITDFNGTAGDMLYMRSAAFGALPRGVLDESAFHIGNQAADASDRFVFNATTGELWFDADGIGGAAQQLLATFAAGTAIAADDIFLL